MNKNYIVAIVAVLVFIGGIVYVVLLPNTGVAPVVAPTPVVENVSSTTPDTTSQNTGTTKTTTTTTTTNVTTTTPPPVVAPLPTSYTFAQVQSHNSKSNCWSVVSGKVYDLSSWIGQHPGGQSAILSMCGKDSTSAFNDQHGGQNRPKNELDGFFIGLLAN